MERLEEIKARKLELRELLEDETKEVNLEEVEKEISELKAEEDSINADLEAAAKEEEAKEAAKEKEQAAVAEKEESKAEERRNAAKDIESRKITGTKIEKEERNMNEQFGVSSKEYRSAWAKKLMGLSEDKFTEEEKRALGDAVTTTATTFVAATADANGVNNGGLLIPTSVREEILEIIEKESPIFRDIRKLQVNGNIDLPYLYAADDSAWYAETVQTANEGIEFKNLQLTGWELAKDIVVTWKLEEMAVDSFIKFIIDELANKMGKALVNAVIYGDGSSKPTGMTNGLTAVTTGDTPLDTILNTYKSLSDDAKVGAKIYVSTNCNIALVGYKNQEGNYPFMAGVPATAFGGIEVDPFLSNYDIVVGNPRNYILNEQTPVRIDRESTIKGRKVTYGGYAVVDGKPKPGAFAYGKYTPASSM